MSTDNTTRTRTATEYSTHGMVYVQYNSLIFLACIQHVSFSKPKKGWMRTNISKQISKFIELIIWILFSFLYLYIDVTQFSFIFIINRKNDAIYFSALFYLDKNQCMAYPIVCTQYLLGVSVRNVTYTFIYVYIK